MSNPIKILHISPDFNYSCGVSKHVFSILKHYSVNDSYKLFFITNGGDALEKLEEIGVTPFILKFSRGRKNILYLLSNLYILKKYCIKNSIDIIHTHHRYPEYLSYLVSKKIKLKTITTVHSLVKGKNKFSFKSYRFIVVSKTVEKMIKENYHIHPNKVTMLYNSIEPLNNDYQENKEELKYKLGIPINFKIILFLGRIAKVKGIDLLIDAFNIVQNEKTNLFLLIVGQIYDKSLKGILKKLPFNIKLINSVKNPYPFYSISDLVVLPSREETFGYVILESGLFKKPFIGANTGGIAELVEDNVNGLLFEKGSVNQLAEKINYVLNNPEKSEIFGKNLFLKVKKNISSEKYYATLSEIYKNLILEK